MAEETLATSHHSSFQCCVCLDLLFKPVVLACGHTSCFWCVHKAMHGLKVSHCAMCRQPYIHFPSVCQLLHLLISKMEPLTFKRREEEVLEEEMRLDVFSPQFTPLPSEKICSDGNCSDSLTNVQNSFVNHENVKTKISIKAIIQQDGPKNAFLVDIYNDALCAICQELLFQPAVLNCGHVFCEPCLAGLGSEVLKCCVCKSTHPGEFPKMCLDLGQFFEEQFPIEYAARRERLQHEKTRVSCEELSTGVSGEAKNTKPSNSNDFHLQLNEDVSKINVGIGCDSCGMYPLIGKRFKCIDCKETVGFDLCESCYNSSSKLPGRFNQQHHPDHLFEIDGSHLLYNFMFITSPSMEEDDQNGVLTFSDENAESSYHSENESNEEIS